MKKIIIKGRLIVKTGLHIGGDTSFSAIGAVDSPVIKSSATGKPIIPGSSLKGKIRSLLAKNKVAENVDFKNEPDFLKRLFGSDEYRSRLIFSDLNVCDSNLEFYTEVKYENTINRIKGSALPRQLERVSPEVGFNFFLVYNVIEEKDLKEDFLTISEGLKLLIVDYLGGGGTRGNGRVVFEDLKAETENNYNLDGVNSKLKEVVEFGAKLHQ